MINRRELGNNIETRCCEFLNQNGIKILERNFRNKTGEIDIIGFGDPYKKGALANNGYLIFFEVKYRKNQTSGYAESAVDLKKQKIICAVSDYYRMIKGVNDNMPIRYDVLAINDTDISWHKNAFDYMPSR